ncbi:basic salivary proline-rich protein 2-like [Perognathus longimembris pacificus]|uniref:basic salivary proline-rich protein 2-like n=1 Tax=Perognathus longimembris pacificus TaxID=214514 RepID=UPI0020191D1A|nr:basic salivary proline-rich protein 2-like [Perognathus longimembris pacificus]
MRGPWHEPGDPGRSISAREKGNNAWHHPVPRARDPSPSQDDHERQGLPERRKASPAEGGAPGSPGARRLGPPRPGPTAAPRGPRPRREAARPRRRPRPRPPPPGPGPAPSRAEPAAPPRAAERDARTRRAPRPQRPARRRGPPASRAGLRSAPPRPPALRHGRRRPSAPPPARADDAAALTSARPPGSAHREPGASPSGAAAAAGGVPVPPAGPSARDVPEALRQLPEGPPRPSTRRGPAERPEVPAGLSHARNGSAATVPVHGAVHPGRTRRGEGRASRQGGTPPGFD